MIRSKKFTLEEGLLVQQTQLSQWKRKLNSSCFKALQNECATHNLFLDDKSQGNNVFRGNDLLNFIQNWKP